MKLSIDNQLIIFVIIIVFRLGQGRMQSQIRQLILDHLNSHQSGWSVGSYGALGEFVFDPDETLLIEPDDRLTIATARGALRVDRLGDVELVAYETPRKHPEKWGQSVALCLPELSATMNHRKVITEIGSDHASILDENSDAVLFDLGLGTPYVDVCIRSANAELTSVLRAAEGESIWEAKHGAMAAILKQHPHRVFISAVARLEVFAPIGIEKSPEGPHTHVLPELLATGRHHAAGASIPEGMYASLMLYPGNPCIDNLGRARDFDAGLYEGFQALLARFGPSDYVKHKHDILAAYQQGADLGSLPKPESNMQRIVYRNALRQLRHLAGASERLDDWQARFDRPKMHKNGANASSH